MRTAASRETATRGEASSTTGSNVQLGMVQIGVRRTGRARFTTAKVVTISQAAHFMISTHPKEVAHTLAQHVIAQNGRTPAVARGAATHAY